jgi:Domain of unknown function (DUF4395)
LLRRVGRCGVCAVLGRVKTTAVPAARSITMDIDPRGPRFGAVITTIVLAAVLLNAAFDFCLGCQVYLFIQRDLRVRPSA